MKALTLTQPWASLVALGHKKVETRSWATHYRGELAIHAAKGYPRSAREFALFERGYGRLPERIPLSAVVCIVRVVDVKPTEEAAPFLSGLERHLGDYSPGRFAWFLEMVEVLEEPVPAKGSLGLWEWTMTSSARPRGSASPSFGRWRRTMTDPIFADQSLAIEALRQQAKMVTASGTRQMVSLRPAEADSLLSLIDDLFLGTCDWGDCGELAVTTRSDHEAAPYPLPVCVRHSKEYALLEALLASHHGEDDGPCFVCKMEAML